MHAPPTWCPRCGGLLVEGACANCTDAEERRLAHRRFFNHYKLEVFRWVTTFTRFEAGETPMSALFEALLAGPDEHADVFLDPIARIVVAIPGRPERTIEVPPGVRMALNAFIELHLELGTRFAIERIEGGFRLRLAR